MYVWRERCLPFFSSSWNVQKSPCCVLHCLSRLSPISRQEKMMYHPFILLLSPKSTLQGRERSNLLWHSLLHAISKGKVLEPVSCQFPQGFVRHNLKRKLAGNSWNGLRSLVVNVVTRGKFIVITIWSEINACRGSYRIGSYWALVVGRSTK